MPERFFYREITSDRILVIFQNEITKNVFLYLKFYLFKKKLLRYIILLFKFHFNFNYSILLIFIILL
jgi:hypothetical protein